MDQLSCPFVLLSEPRPIRNQSYLPTVLAARAPVTAHVCRLAAAEHVPQRHSRQCCPASSFKIL